MKVWKSDLYMFGQKLYTKLDQMGKEDEKLSTTKIVRKMSYYLRKRDRKQIEQLGRQAKPQQQVLSALLYHYLFFFIIIIHEICPHPCIPLTIIIIHV